MLAFETWLLSVHLSQEEGLTPAIFNESRCKIPPRKKKYLSRTSLSERKTLPAKGSSSTGLKGFRGFQLSMDVNICSTKVLEKAVHHRKELSNIPLGPAKPDFAY